MATYAIGDVQGHYAHLLQLLEKINFQPQQDRLWFTGDLVNRGPQSLEVLRFVQSLGEQHITVLGNHDLHLLAVYYGGKRKPHDTLDAILTAADKEDLMTWLRTRPLVHYDVKLNYVLVHAGFAPTWTLAKAQNLAHEVEAALQSADCREFLQAMYGNQPDYWHDALTGMERLRIITNYLTRVRYCYADGRMDFHYKGPLADKPAPLIPWYALPQRQTQTVKIIFGHWASLAGQANYKNIYALDTGCSWGNCLTAMRLEDEMRFSIKCC